MTKTKRPKRQTEREHHMYNQLDLDETQDFSVADGFVSFTRIFWYLGSLVSYNLHEDNDITARIAAAAANAVMGAFLVEVWRNTHLECTTSIFFSEPSQSTYSSGVQ